MVFRSVDFVIAINPVYTHIEISHLSSTRQLFTVSRAIHNISADLVFDPNALPSPG